jgi:hypothetical protein
MAAAVKANEPRPKATLLALLLESSALFVIPVPLVEEAGLFGARYLKLLETLG